MRLAGLKVLLAIGWSGVNNTGTSIQSHILSGVDRREATVAFMQIC